MRRRIVVQCRHCFEGKGGDNSTTNHVLRIYLQCTQFPRDHSKPMIFLEVCKK